MNQNDTMDQMVRNWLLTEAPEAPPVDVHALAMKRVAAARQPLSVSTTVGALLRPGSRGREAGHPASRRQAFAFAVVFVALSVVTVAALAFLRGGLLPQQGSTPFVPVATPSASPGPSLSPTRTLEPTATASLGPVTSTEVSDFSIPFEYLAPESLELQESGAPDYYQVHRLGRSGGEYLIVARLDGAHADDCPRRHLSGSVSLEGSVDSILETLETEGGMTFQRNEIGLLRSGGTAIELETTAECLDHIHLGSGATVYLTKSSAKTWVMDAGGGAVLMQAFSNEGTEDEWLSMATDIVGSIVFSEDLRPAPSSSPSISRTEFESYLAGYGQVFTPGTPPTDVVQPSSTHLTQLRTELGDPTVTTYGIVTCVNEALNCARRGLARPGVSLPIWLVEFPVVTGCPVWFTFDATTGQMINGTTPPC